MRLLIAAILVISTSQVTQAWSINGHLYVASIGEKMLNETSSSSLEAAHDLLQKLTDYDAEFTWREQDHALVECSTFADDYKYRGEGWQSYYHYINLPWVAEGDDPANYEIRTKDKNITVACKDIVAWLSGKQGDGHEQSHIYTYLMGKYAGNEEVAKSYALRMLVHFFGDIVQPLHNMNRYTADYPKGDKGANAFKLPYRYAVKSLHSLWDKVLYEERYNIRRPFTEETWAEFSIKVDEAMEDHLDCVVRKFGPGRGDVYSYGVTDFDDWAEEGFELSKSLYKGIVENETVPEAYLKKNIPLAYEQLVLGGYRMYLVLDYIFS